MNWVQFLALLCTYLASLFTAYRQGSKGAIEEVKSNNEAKQAKYVKIQEKADHISADALADELQDGTRRF